MKLPKHIHPNDDSPNARRARYMHWLEMYERNPKGFRKPSSKKVNGELVGDSETMVARLAEGYVP